MFLCLGRSWSFQVAQNINITGDRSPKTALQERRSWPATFTAAPSMLHAAWLWPKLMYRYNSMEHFGDPSSKLLSLDALAISGFRTPVGLRGGVAVSPQQD